MPRAQPGVSDRLGRLPDARLADGPGLVTAAFGIDRTWTGLDLCDPDSPLHLQVSPGGVPPRVLASPRIGISYAGSPWTDVPWRFSVVDD